VVAALAIVAISAGCGGGNEAGSAAKPEQGRSQQVERGSTGAGTTTNRAAPQNAGQGKKQNATTGAKARGEKQAARAVQEPPDQKTGKQRNAHHAKGSDQGHQAEPSRENQGQGAGTGVTEDQRAG